MKRRHKSICFSYKLSCIRQNSSKIHIQLCLLFLTIKYDSMYNKKSAQFIDLNASTKLVGVVSVKQLQQIDFVCLFFSSPITKYHILLCILGP